ncbi:uncharacterized protein LOC130730831 [Lotus japonicus]|uniref:uncharacterized protein LOC130730831 n=1 Tax=Lotus japonicus TaxID=34305 RepID=UPI00258EFB88|nr:uncharacterized protein LOC130730831 [Lotus japonicus]XP_057438937.1 uncharacterized protein LOC130730831 [Lotus japonicus]XP_057438938.1 uncharacterized protein LOC130730831 [Lotus japonicus]XP_057438939.1 uncharacterized protein LOC130730831 [Lotus japonicus]XP_057438940.1 uncharacterized protein LOC130730831 [Lotus japonicus]XP_057438941.1 uncharacterized protein LOC130730831 [Lotus japonicus]XP_057438942.1 uncharacterized protein LOC130730831 [Lotus japonicus]
MAKKRHIVQYRERLDRTLASPDLTNGEMLKTLVKSQLLRSSQFEIEGYEDKFVETKTAEITNFLDMISASVDNSGGSSISHTDWKLKQDNEDYRVMYREGPEGTPFHTLMVEGYIDGPVDVCLCLSWEAPLYKKWWPQFTVPPFKVLAADCLQKVQIGEQISLVRMKVPWPLSKREAIVHYYLVEYFQEDLTIVLIKSVSESESMDGAIDGINRDAIPEAKDVVRIDFVGGYVLQKVTSERSYFRTMANLDIKLDFVPPTLINFISRQLIGSGFRLYQKAVSSMMNNDKEIIKTLGDSLYVGIREALYNTSGSNAMDGEELNIVSSILPAEEHAQSKQDGTKHVSWEDRGNQSTSNCNGEILEAGNGEIVEEDSEEIVQIAEDVNKVLKGKRNDKIVDADNEEISEAENEEIVQIEEVVKKVHDITIEEDSAMNFLKRKKNVSINSDVKKALETLEKAISMVREYGFHPRRPSFRFGNEERKDSTVESYTAKPSQLSSKVSVEVSSSNTLNETLEEPVTNSEIQNIRHTGTNPNLKEVNHNKVVPAASPEQNLQRLFEESRADSFSMKNEATLNQTTSGSNQLDIDAIQDMSLDDKKKSSRKKNYIYCCFLR